LVVLLVVLVQPLVVLEEYQLVEPVELVTELLAPVAPVVMWVQLVQQAERHRPRVVLVVELDL
jgi:hypothetical protein